MAHRRGHRGRHQVWRESVGGALRANYTASAVRFAGANALERASALTGVSDSPLGLFSVWIRSDLSIPLIMRSTNTSINDGDQALFVQGSLDPIENFGFAMFDGVLDDGVWHHLLMAWNTNFTVGNRIYQVYIDDVVRAVDDSDDSGEAFAIVYSENSSWELLTQSIDAAQYYFAPSQFLDLSVEANRRKFISALLKPVNLGADGSTPTGAQPAVFFDGDAVSFATNKGSGGAFTCDALENAPTSPSG